jgi:hypothetical protein
MGRACSTNGGKKNTSGILAGKPEENSYWVLWSFPSSGILETRKHDVSETGSVFVLR